MKRLPKGIAPGLVLLLLAFAGAVVSAQQPDSKKPAAPETDVPNLTVEVDTTDVARLQLSVRGPDLKKPLQFDLKPQGAEFVRGIAVPPGEYREITVTAFGKKGEKLYSGKGTASIDAKLTLPFAIPLMTPSSRRAGSVVLGTHRLRLDSERLNEKGPIRVRARLIDASGETVPLKAGEISWGTVGLPDGGFVPCTEDPVGCIELNPSGPGLASPDAMAACLRDIWCKGSAQRPPEGPWVRVAVGTNHTCALAKNGKLYCWGDGRADQLGFRAGPNCRLSASVNTFCELWPAEVPCSAGGVCPFRTVAAAGDHTCTIDNRSNVWCWGNFSIFTGIGSNVGPGHRQIVEPGPSGSPIVASLVDTNLTNGCATRRPTGTVVCWSGNTTVASSVASTANYRAIATGTGHTCGIQLVGWLDCWGANANSQLAPRDDPRYTALVSSPQPLQMHTIHPLLNRSTGYDAIAVDDLMSCTKLGNGDGRVVCWGGLELLNTDPSPPTIVRDAQDGYVFSNGSVSDPGLAVSTRRCSGLRCTHICAISNPGILACGSWGAAGRPTLAPVPGQPTDVRFVQVDTGPNHTCAVSSKGFIYCIGSNEYGQLGDGTTTSRNTLVKAGGLPEPPLTFVLRPPDDRPRPGPPPP